METVPVVIGWKGYTWIDLSVRIFVLLKCIPCGPISTYWVLAEERILSHLPECSRLPFSVR
jgi:hypothetical protein